MKDDLIIFVSTIAPLFAFSDKDAAIGAAMGCAFFLSTRYDGNLLNRMLLTVVSYGIGYGAGLAVVGAHTMIVALFGAGLGSAIIGAGYRAVTVARDAVGRSGADFAPWAKTLLELILRIRK